METNQLPLSKYLKQSSTAYHDKVDQLVMNSKPFDSLAHYGNFLKLQHLFHGVILPLYKKASLNHLLEGLEELQRFDAVKQDLQDLQLQVPADPTAIKVDNDYKALGWLYCSEGSNLGAAFLFKESQCLGLNENYGARHLAAHPSGRKLHWKAFVEKLDQLNLTEEQREQAVIGGKEAFDFYYTAIDKFFIN